MPGNSASSVRARVSGAVDNSETNSQLFCDVTPRSTSAWHVAHQIWINVLAWPSQCLTFGARVAQTGTNPFGDLVTSLIRLRHRGR